MKTKISLGYCNPEGDVLYKKGKLDVKSEKSIDVYNSTGLTVYKNGSYSIEEEQFITEGSIFEYHDIISCQFNQLKGKLFNLIEASITDRKQCEAVKGLIKDFCNSKFGNTIEDIKGLFQRLGFEIEATPASCEPLENSDSSVE